MTPDQLLAARYNELAPSAAQAGHSPPAWSALIAQLLGHRSVRRYLPTPVSDAQLTAIIAAAQSASSSSNLQAWSVIAVRDADTRAALAGHAGDQAHVREAPLQLVWLADLARLKAVAAHVGLAHDALDFMEMFVVGVVDAALAAQNAMAAAQSLGLAGCYIGGLRNRPQAVAELLDLPPQVFAVFGMTLGTEDPMGAASVKPRLSQGVVLHHERYVPVEAQMPGIEDYNQAMTRFYEQQQMAVRGTWSVHSAKRVATAQALTGRDRLVEALHQLGFALK